MLSQREKITEHLSVDTFNEKSLQLAATQEVLRSVTSGPNSPTGQPPSFSSRQIPECPDSLQPPGSRPQFPEGLTTLQAEMLAPGCPPSPLLWPWRHLTEGDTEPQVPKRAPPQNSTISSPKALTSRLHVLKNKLTTRFISSIISKSTYWVYLWEPATQLGLGVEM